MATEQQVTELQEKINGALVLGRRELISRPEWGAIKFDSAKSDLDRIFSVLSNLSVLPLHYLPDNIATRIRDAVEEVRRHLQQLDSYRIDQGGDITATRNQLVQYIRNAADGLFSETASWLPFLAYQKGDVAKNIEELSGAVRQGAEIVESAKSGAQKAQAELGRIIASAREAAASTGAGVFTEEFLTEAQKQLDEADKWLKATAWMAAITVIVALVLWFYTEPGLDQGQLIQKFGSKLVVLVFMFTATLWCGRIYKALRHQAANNRHRGLSLKTFQAFSNAAQDDTTKNAVLLETTKCIFANTATGYIEQSGSGQESELKIIEVVKSVASNKGTSPP